MYLRIGEQQSRGHNSKDDDDDGDVTTTVSDSCQSLQSLLIVILETYVNLYCPSISLNNTVILTAGLGELCPYR